MKYMVITFLLLFISASVSAKVYQCQQADGTLLYSDKECPKTSSQLTVIKSKDEEKNDNELSGSQNRQDKQASSSRSNKKSTTGKSKKGQISKNQLIGDWTCVSDVLEIKFRFKINNSDYLRSANVMGMSFKSGGSWSLTGDKLVLNMKWEEGPKGRKNQSSTQKITLSELTSRKMLLLQKDKQGDTRKTNCTK